MPRQTLRTRLSVIVVAATVALFACIVPAAYGQEQRWPDERVAEDFYFHADFSLQRSAPLLAELIALRKELEQTLKLPTAHEPIHLFLFGEKQTYQEYLRIHFPKAPDRRALFIKARGPGMVFAHCGLDFETDVRHECTHAVLHTVLPRLPLWLDEGLAEYFEVPANKRNEENPHSAAVKGLARLAELPRLEALEELTDINDLGRREYREAWAWVHFCLEGPAPARQELQLYLADLAEGTATESLGKRLQRRIARLDDTALAHFTNLR